MAFLQCARVGTSADICSQHKKMPHQQGRLDTFKSRFQILLNTISLASTFYMCVQLYSVEFCDYFADLPSATLVFKAEVYHHTVGQTELPSQKGPQSGELMILK